ncbi:hypothetical protein Vadar_012375 [Vaccinium darrowii]|uniref:Uncharacterized protein n=1 Tax=Vaccinium darrowii TaxID=229202 RepID=A0ACB7Z483_9ERIC|nr:hypothetical protein Vadar_012375 [Vaccinium darrowii]
MKTKQRSAMEKNDLKEKNELLKEENTSDRISDLPDELLHHIFSFLPIQSIVQSSVLAKRWTHLWRSHPHLDFSRPSPTLVSPRLPSNTIPIVFSRRQQDSNITSFRLFGHVSPSCLRDYINRVMNHRIELLELDVYLNSGFDLPKCLFNCNTLGVLTLHHRNHSKFRGGYFQLQTSSTNFNYPTSVGLPSVHTLSLTNAYFEHGSDLFSGEKFPLLRKLCLENCIGLSDLNINCPGLEILELEGFDLKDLDVSGIGLLELHVTTCFRSCVNGSANILAPCLRSLYWRGGIPVEFTTNIFKDLNACTLHIETPKDKIQEILTLRSVSTFVSALCLARSLSFGSGRQFLETLSKMDSEGGLPFSFDNLRTLELHTNMTKDEITGLTCLLRSSPKLDTITISINSYPETRNEGWNKKQYGKFKIQNLLSIEFHLKFARIYVHDTKMHGSELYFVNLLLRHGKALQEITLALSSNHAITRSQRRKIHYEMTKFAKTSCKVLISSLP